MDETLAHNFSRTEPFTVRFTADELAEIRKLAVLLGSDTSKIIRFLVRRGIESLVRPEESDEHHDSAQ